MEDGCAQQLHHGSHLLWVHSHTSEVICDVGSWGLYPCLQCVVRVTHYSQLLGVALCQNEVGFAILSKTNIVMLHST